MAAPLPTATRLLSIDAYRGFVMMALLGEGFLNALGVDYFPHSAFWQLVGAQFDTLRGRVSRSGI